MSGLKPTDCIILGSGASVLDLDLRQRQLLNSHPSTLALNKFLLFNEIAQIVPKNVFLADSHFPAPLVARDLLVTAKKMSTPIRIFLNQSYADLFGKASTCKSFARRVVRHYQISRQYRYWSGVTLSYPNLTFFKSSPFANNRPLFWASDLSEELYFHRGSLTTALNLADIVFSPKRIILVGVDLNDPRCFFDDDPRLIKYRDHTYVATEKEYGMHGTACPHPTAAPIQEILKDIVQFLQRKGLQVCSANPNSLLCCLGICPSLSI
jgi:hypothetical protein